MNKLVGKPKPKPPPYPRPVPQLDIEELPPTDEDIVWSAANGGGYYSDNSESEQDEGSSNRRAAKRRRIETCAQAYLRGEGLFIMSACIKGPLQRDWKNPWAKRSKQRQTRAVGQFRHLEIPETAKKIPSSVEEDKILQLPVATPGRRPTSRSSLRRQPLNKPNKLEQAPSPFTSRRQNLPSEPSPKVPQQAKEKRVQEWLRTNEGLPKSEILVHSSPTPASRQRRSPSNSSESIGVPRASQSEPPPARTPGEIVAGTIQSPHAGNTERLTGLERRVQQLSREMQNIIAEPLAQPSADLQDEVRKLAIPRYSLKGVNDASRAEFAILKARNRALQVAPANAHMSPFEFKRTTEGDQGQTKQAVVTTNMKLSDNIANDANIKPGGIDPGPAPAQLDSTDKADDVSARPNEEFFATAPQLDATKEIEKDTIEVKAQNKNAADIMMLEVAPGVTSTAQPMLSTAISDLSTTDMLPSAQLRPDQIHLMSSMTRDDKLNSIKQTPSVLQKSEIFNGTGQNTSHAEQVSSIPEVEHSKGIGLDQNLHNSPDGEAETFTPKPVYNVAELNTQEMLANIEPLELSTIKKPKASLNRHSPITVTKTVSDKKRKKTSFALNPSSISSHNSIKESMKAKVSKNLGSPPSFLFGKDNLDVEVSDEENNNPQKRSKSHDSPVKAKGILKSTNSLSSPNTQRRTKGGILTGLEPDGQTGSNLPLASGQNAVEDDQFDLDAAIDDLGSFLGTWDAEREASSMEIEL